jgi:hypothetical protein
MPLNVLDHDHCAFNGPALPERVNSCYPIKPEQNQRPK